MHRNRVKISMEDFQEIQMHMPAEASGIFC